jgi:hypothetical protein
LQSPRGGCEQRILVKSNCWLAFFRDQGRLLHSVCRRADFFKLYILWSQRTFKLKARPLWDQWPIKNKRWLTLRRLLICIIIDTEKIPSPHQNDIKMIKIRQYIDTVKKNLLINPYRGTPGGHISLYMLKILRKWPPGVLIQVFL